MTMEVSDRLYFTDNKATEGCSRSVGLVHHPMMSLDRITELKLSDLKLKLPHPQFRTFAPYKKKVFCYIDMQSGSIKSHFLVVLLKSSCQTWFYVKE
jgi:hypothetical protein